MKIEDDFESMVLMDSVQLEKCPPSKIRQTLLDNDSETIIATVYAAASNHVGWLMYDLDEDDCTEETKQEYNEWEILENEISNKIFDILKTEDIKEYERLVAQNTVIYDIMKPFMQRNGYIYDHGWWVKK